ncbi:MAG: NlpC/P60 family protein, partial [Nocardioidaceae bacterium]
RAAVVVCAALAAGFSTAAPSSLASPAPDEPSLSEVRDRVERLGHEAEMANERYLMLVDQIRETKGQLKATRKDVRDQRAEFAKIKEQVTSAVVADATDSPLGTTGELLNSGDPGEFIDGLGAMQAYNSTQTDLLSEYTTMADELGTREDQLTEQLDSIDQAKQKMADEKAEVNEKAGEAQALLDELEAEQRENLFDTPDDIGDGPSRDDDRIPTDDSGSDDATGNAATAIAFAEGQLGDPYVYGAAGPDSWDCSGLTSGAWAAAGVALPRSSSSQAAVGTPVSTSDMEPGDLVFYYSPISHVALYVGDGTIIHAPHTGDVVRYAPVNEMPIATVRRVG